MTNPNEFTGTQLTMTIEVCAVMSIVEDPEFLPLTEEQAKGIILEGLKDVEHGDLGGYNIVSTKVEQF